ncbi:uncharacterized protein LOC129257977 [Lytechinus pictus]|uniref:uncharacterized protein LOC129257977 n=1 Tax=Lytechinus pictus TaxID=7653 RepID=UPI0030B9E95D
MLGSYHEVCSSMKSKRFYVVISITAFVGIALWTLYQQVSSHPVDTWNHYSGKRHRKITSFSPLSEVSGGSWPVEKHRFLPNFFLLWDKEKSPTLSSYSEGNIIFLHHNKAGGISIRKCMQAVGPESGLNVSRNVFSYRYTAREFDYWKHAARTKQRMGLYGGYSFGVCDVITDGRPCSYFTMIRDPYDRAVSAYLYCSKNASKDQLCTALRASEVSVVDWAIHHGSFFFRQLVFNPAVCNGSYDNSPYLGNFDDFPHKFASDVIPCWFKHKVLLQRMLSEKERLDLLKHVHDNLENYFAVIGLLDNFDLTMGMLQHVYHVPFRDRCADTHKNQGRFRKRRQKIEADLLVAKLKRELLADPRVNASLHADLVLYEKAKQIFNRQKEVFKYLTKTTS